jgi:D-alanyl-lipoteichoic acid acyltransferase DltB (MBOAT superfamily)
MLFNSLDFALFFPLVAALFFLVPHRLRAIHLLFASWCFYAAWRPAYLLIVLFTTLLDYVAALGMDGRADGLAKRAFLSLALAGNLGILFVFKYFDFFVGQAWSVANALGHPFERPALGLVLPLGISFHTFQAMSYALDVFHGRVKVERHLGLYFLFVVFFPQLVAGPIERAGNMLPQFRERHALDLGRVARGLQLMAWGLFKKSVIADRLAPYVDRVYDHPRDWTGLPLVLATVAFAYQIYCDFSGYSDIALGSAEVLGFRLSTNFRSPYSAASISEFWRRWHISLSSWFRDYVFIPLGGSRVSSARRAWNVLVTFVLSGLWHGASWTFVAWGALNGLYLVLGIATEDARASLSERAGLARFPRAGRALATWTTFALACAAWVFFRARTFEDAAWVFSRAGVSTEGLAALAGGQTLDVAVALAALAVLGLAHRLQESSDEPVRERLGRAPVWARYAVYWSLGFALLFFGKFESRQFIYFQF